MNIYTHRLELWTSLNEDEISDRLDELHTITIRLEVDKTHAVARARVLGYSWQQIADRLGTTKQTAWDKWHHLDRDDDKPRLSPKLEDAAMRQVLGDD